MIKYRLGFRPRAISVVGTAVVMAGLIAAGFLAFLPASEDAADTEQWVNVQQAPLAIRLGLVGRLEAATTVTLTAPFDGTIQDRLVSDGQRVTSGQRLFSLSTTQLDIQLRQALAELLKAKRAVQDLESWADGQEVGRARRALATARMGLADTKRKLGETRLLLDRGIVPRMEVDALEQQTKQQMLDLASAEADLQATLARGQGEHRQIAEMELANAAARYDDLLAAKEQRDIIAPFSGVAVTVPGAGSPVVPVYAGSRVAPGQPLTGLASIERVQAVAKVDESDINQVQEGMLVEVTGDGFEGIVLQGKIDSVGRQGTNIDSQGASAAYLITVKIPPLTEDQQANVRLGMSARISIIVYRNERALVVPMTGISRTGGNLFVTHRESSLEPARSILVTAGRATPTGLEVFGLPAGQIKIQKNQRNP